MKDARLIILHAITSVHAGSGSNASYVDLPFQREVNTDLPVIHSSGIRGVFRAMEFEKIDKENLNEFLKNFGGGEDLKNEFGERDEFEPSKAPSGISFTDGKLLLFPVRTLKGVIAWVTSPFVLKRFERDLKIFKFDSFDPTLSYLSNDSALVSRNSEIVLNDSVILEDFRIEVQKEDLSFLDKLANFLPDTVDKEFFKSHFVVVSDDILRDLTRLGAEITPRIRIDKKTGTVAKGALWYEENVPAETVFYSIVVKTSNDASLDFLNSYKSIQLGGKESIGHGIFSLRVKNRGDEK